MTYQELIVLFNQGIRWNAGLYLLHKILSTALSFLLFYKLTPHDFSTWANCTSIIFITLLWLDVGLRKSIPRYAPDIAANKTLFSGFMTKLIVFKLCLIIAATPLLFFLLNTLRITAKLPTMIDYTILIAVLFIVEGMSDLLGLIFHSYFWQKQFNTLVCITTTVQMGSVMIFTTFSYESDMILWMVFFTRIVATSVIILCSVFLFNRLSAQRKQISSHLTGDMQHASSKNIMLNFVRHSGAMWAMSSIKSITERNCLVPLITHIFGHEQANLFKIALDGALFFYRTIVKSIGTTDTSLLAYTQELPQSQNLMPIAFKKLFSLVAALCLPLFGITVTLFLIISRFYYDPYVYQIFFIIICCYMIETLCSPFERVLEVKRLYSRLFCAYTPYLLLIGSLLLLNSSTSIGFITFLACVHGVRLVSSLCLVYASYTS